MAYQIGEKAKAIHERLKIFMEQHIYPREKDYDEFTSNHENLWQYTDWYEDLKKEAKKQELWDLFLPKEYAPWSPGLTNVEIAVLFETMSRSAWAQQVFNCNAPDRGNMEVLAKYGTPEQQKEWLDPLLDGKIRSAYAMTEPDVASSDATNMELEIKRDGDEYVLNGRKWWTTNVINPHCKIMLVMGKSNPGNSRHTQHSTILVPTDTPGVEIVRSLRVFGENHSPGGEGDVEFKNVRVPVTNLILGEGRGFEIAQGRLGPGRFQYAMMFVGMAQRSLELMCDRAQNRVAFGEALSKKTSVQHEIARSRCDIEQCRLLVMAAAEKMDNHGIDAARDYISMLKIVAPKMCEDVSSRAMLIFGGMGVCQDTPLAHIFTTSRFCRIADGPDEVHMSQLAKLTMRSLSTKD